jgi:hypothetical protein
MVNWLGIYLTPFIPLSFKGEGDIILEEGAQPPLKYPLPGLFREGIKRGEAPFKLP